METVEQWKPIDEYGCDYWVSDKGRVRSKKRQVILKQYENENGYMRVYLWRYGKARAFFVHRIVLSVFSGKCPEGKESRHLDGEKKNNRLENLRWGTRAENREDCLRQGRVCPVGIGEKHPKAKLTEELVRHARRLYENMNVPIGTLARSMHVDYKTMQAVIEGRTWKQVTP